ncbi:MULTISPECIES: metallophosphoesterase [unclassified Chelatococcus]|uniref:metallophosphoesterase n=1 Tax=unclassified Chelatococcus TaxID=2638111 RepID=UPI001BCE1407|nr:MULTISPECIES: metallophosphoesterase [unclassified Chelatococcus]CAH1655331.1 3',5'-cyclic AMP phosphodiesterase CpdA [Hyphomicrobiales bacterium]MBS7742626.1 metallophosphoesterase [Chelatococcus sp. HY11]MBX3542256.1 metallophosphoesterase [Chelatococcus sp.]MCO5075526.1 metallophosphoesterase [Chelatococcus sp.]CAH1695430.1 3',5'-cyclic AMP phosphodiesterase CpdA [Hyphomicrobiales bacterium]
MTGSVTFVHLTDIHVSDASLNDTKLHSDTSANLAAILEELKRLEPVPSFIVASGDLTNHGDATSYARLKQIIADSGVTPPLLVSLGNHDNREGFYPGFLGRDDQGLKPYDHDQVIDGVHIIVLDSSVPHWIGGGFEAGQLAWLEARLDAHPDLPKLLVSHHAPALDDDVTMEWESLTLADTERLRKLLAGRSNVLGILCGHIHYDRVSHWHGIPVVVGMGQHAATDPLTLSNGLRQLSGTGFVVGTVRPSGLTVSFCPMPADRHEINYLPYDRIREVAAERLAAANAASVTTAA